VQSRESFMKTNSYVDLYKMSAPKWAVKTNDDNDVVSFNSIEDAALYLEGIGISSDEIDSALIDMAGYSHTRAQFNVSDGRFTFSDGERLNDVFGAA
jgi:hypothetical protein